MQAMRNDAEGYLDAFMNGFEFVLLAIRGRLAEGSLPAAERARLEAFLADYWRIVGAYKERHAAPEEHTPFIAELLPVASN